MLAVNISAVVSTLFTVESRFQTEIPSAKPAAIAAPSAVLSGIDGRTNTYTHNISHQLSCVTTRTTIDSMCQWLSGRVLDLQSGGCRFKSWAGLLHTKVYSAFHPSRFGKSVPAAAGKAKADMAHSACGWNVWCAGKLLSLDNRTALTTSHRGWEPIGFNWIHPRRKSYGVLPVDDSTRFQLRQSVYAQPLSSPPPLFETLVCS